MATQAWVATPGREPAMVGPDEFVFLNRRGRLTDGGWDGPEVPRLWRYNLHYFDDLRASRAAERRLWHADLISRWIDENPPTSGSGWEPYPTSLRIVNWISWSLAGGSLENEALASLAVQTRWLEQRLEHHLLGNHLFVNAKALVFAGVFFEGPEAERWRRTGIELLVGEFNEQFLADGGHFERSPMYHAMLLVDLLDLQNLERCLEGGALLPRSVVDRLPQLLSWLGTMCHPDGDIAFFNDAAFGIAPSLAEVEGYAARLGMPPQNAPKGIVHLQGSGYVRVESGAGVLLIDAAAVGPDYLPAHAHADTLSFELSIGSQRVIVNGGTSMYGTSPLRDRERGTAAHSTVEINGQNSSEVWAGFRVGRRAKPLGVSVEQQDAGCVVRAGHDGYDHLPGAPRHHRAWRIDQNQGVVIEDQISGRFDRAVAHFHFHPAVLPVPSDDPDKWDIRVGGDRVGSIGVRGGRATLLDGEWHPEFGKSVPNRCLAVEVESNRLLTTIEWK